ncbi:MAG: hypothetical protein ACRD9S_10405 [Pyrinomonadaceae bacterium]
MKECPHCHADTFGASQLIGLDYWSVDQCRECKRLVRNDGLRQFLIIPALLVIFPLAILLFEVIPETLEPFAYLLLISLGGLSLIFLAKPVKFESEVALPPFSPDTGNDKIITVNGWTEQQLHRIVDGFIAENSSGWPLREFELHKTNEGSFRLTFPEDIHPILFAALINYALYPVEFGLSDRKIIAAGRSTLNDTFEGIPRELFGQKAILYVPENDQAYDVVYLQSESGLNFANSLNENNWRQIDDARLPLEVKRLSLIGYRE